MKKDRRLDDLSEFFHEKLCTLIEDLQWRCQEIQLKPEQFSQIVTLHLMWSLAATITTSSQEAGDKQAIEVFKLMLEKARHHNKQFSGMHT